MVAQIKTISLMPVFLASINIMPHKELLDPQGKAIKKNMPTLDINSVEDVRVGKRIELKIDAAHEQEAEALVEKACKKLLANVIMESYQYTIEPVA